MKNILLTTGLMFSVVSTTLPIYEQEREALYALHKLEQDFADVPMVKQNVDMFISIFEMNTQFLEKKLAIANQKAKKALVKNAALTVGMLLSRPLALTSAHVALNVFGNDFARSVGLLNHLAFLEATNNVINAAVTIGNCWTAISLFDVFKERNALKEALALDQEILEQLVTIKELAFFDISTNVAEEPMHELNAEVSEAAELE